MSSFVSIILRLRRRPWGEKRNRGFNEAVVKILSLPLLVSRFSGKLDFIVTFPHTKQKPAPCVLDFILESAVTQSKAKMSGSWPPALCSVIPEVVP